MSGGRLEARQTRVFSPELAYQVSFPRPQSREFPETLARAIAVAAGPNETPPSRGFFVFSDMSLISQRYGVSQRSANGVGRDNQLWLSPVGVHKVIWLVDCRALDRQNPTVPYMAKLTIGRMAKLYGLHRSTLHEAVAKGRITAEVDGKGQKVIDLSEMIRVYGEPPGGTLHFPTPYPNTSPTVPGEALQPLLDELKLLREEVRELRQALLRIEHKPEPVTKPKPKTPTAPQGPVTWAGLLDALEG